MGVLEAICVSVEKGTVKLPVPSAKLRESWGIEGDAHAGDWHRQISLLAGESIDLVREKMPELDYGMFGENLVTRGIDLARLVIGDRLLVGEQVVLEVTQVGKECHNGGCPIQQATGDCIMPREGIFCKVLAGGKLAPGSAIVKFV
ncbi:MOSC domain-containing protein [Chlorobaculum sp. MV4-Y]|jgi:MOSC domain-containing protein YiiM|uniref:MOSC domain-containing protein n=1 Tax=Chlorobaculum sp. MV4-Y TaxID=2976335 RepID=UPI0021B053AC|nr:MOSC domain-containing protein [Chlorobaculum sp. MV4-Y]UWX58294.1 MOSC domain-containing protein [Chlorobaculum sp. MV4-Y]